MNSTGKNENEEDILEIISKCLRLLAGNEDLVRYVCESLNQGSQETGIDRDCGT